jgi:electron transfer flavoprotein beta subunit
MVLKIITLVKQVPDTQNVTGDAMKADGTVNRLALPSIVNPEDLNALEEALKIKSSAGAIITTLSLGPPTAIKVLQESLYRGADDAILVTDQKFAGSDTLATSYALARAINKIGKFDLIICGRQAIDGDTAQVGPQIAEKLGINQLTCVKEILNITAKEIEVKRLIEGGCEIARSKLPVLLTIVAEANEPRFPSVKKMLAYKNIPCKCGESYDDAYIHPECDTICGYIKQWNAEDIKADGTFCGMSGSPTKVKNIQSVVLTARETKMLSSSEADINSLMHELIAEHILG